MSQVYLTLPSDSSYGHHPNNKPAEYITQLHHPLDLHGGEWEVGLSEIIYPRNWLTLRNLAESTIQVLDMTDNSYRLLYVPMRHYENMESLVKEVDEKLTDVANLTWNENTKQVEFTFAAERHRVLWSTRLQKLLGFHRMLWADGEHGFMKWDGRTVWDTMDSMYVYCNIAEHQLVGDSYAPLLRIVPLDGKHGDIVSRSFENVHYVSAKASHFQSVEVNLRDAQGNLVPFQGGRVVIVLHLRKATMPHLSA